MPFEINIGSLTAGVSMDTSELTQDASIAKTIIKNLTDAIRTESVNQTRIQIEQAREAADSTTRIAVANNNRLIQLAKTRAERAKADAQTQVSADKLAISSTEQLTQQVRLQTETQRTATAAVQQATAQVRANAMVTAESIAVTRERTAVTQQGTQQIVSQAAQTRQATAAITQQTAVIQGNNLQVREAIALTNQDTAAINRDIAAINQQTAAIRAQARVEAAEAAARNRGGGTGRSLMEGGRAANIAGTGLMYAGAAISAFDTSVLKTGADLDMMFSQVAGNTNMSVQEIENMKTAIRDMASSSAVPIEDLIQGYMHIANYGYRAADAQRILNVAQMSSLSTGAKTADVAQILARSMKEFKINSADALSYMNMLHTAMAKSDVTLEEMVKHVGPAFASGAAYGVKPTEVNALFSVLAEQFSPSIANTQLKTLFANIARPSRGTRKYLSDAQKETGIPLASDFSPMGLQLKGVIKILEEIRDYARQTGQNPMAVLNNLIPDKRAGLGAAQLMGGSFDELKTRFSELDAQAKGMVDPISENYTRAMNLLNSQVQVLINNFKILAMEALPSVTPVLQDIIRMVESLTGWFKNLSADTKKFVLEAALIAGPALIVSGFALKVAGLTAQIIGLIMQAGGLAGIFSSLTAFLTADAIAIGAITIPIWGVIAAIAAIVAAIVGLVYLYNKLSEGTGKTTEELNKMAHAERDAALQKKADAAETVRLVDEYDKLKSKTNLTTQEQQRLHDILKRIGELSPQLVSGFDSQGHAIGLLADHAHMAAEAFKEMGREAQIASAKAIASDNQVIAQQRAVLDNERKKQIYLLQNRQALVPGQYRTEDNPNANPFAYPTAKNIFGGGGGYGSPVMQPATNDQIAATVKKINELDTAIADMDEKTKSANKSMRDIFHPGKDDAADRVKAQRDDLAKQREQLLKEQAEMERRQNAGDVEKSRKKGEREAERAAEKQKELNEKIKEVEDKIFDLSHPEYEKGFAEVKKHLRENLEAGVPSDRAAVLYGLEWRKVLEGIQEKNKQVQNEIFKMSHDSFAVSRRTAQERYISDITEGIDPTIAAKRRQLVLAEIDDQEREHFRQSMNGFGAMAMSAYKSVIDAGKWYQQQQDKIFHDEVSASMLAAKAQQDELDATRKNSEEQQKDEEDTARIRAEIYTSDLRDYMESLEKKLAGLQEFSVEWKKVYDEIHRVMEEISKEDNKLIKPVKKMSDDFHKVLGSMAGGVKSILGNALEKLFTGDSKNWFKQLLSSFEQMLAQMVAQALAAGIVRALFQGGNFLTGFLGAFGFDDMGNDRKARHWGFDFADLFTKGIGDHTTIHGASRAVSFANRTSSDNSTINVHMHGVTIGSDMNIREVAQKLGWYTKIQMHTKNT